MISMTKLQLKNYMMLVGKIVISLLLISMLGYGCDESKYPQLNSKYLDIYKVLPRPCIESFDGFPGYTLIKQK